MTDNTVSHKGRVKNIINSRPVCNAMGNEDVNMFFS